MEETKKIRTRDQIPTEDKWAVEDLYPSDEAWEAELNTLESDKKELTSFAGCLGKCGETLFAYLTKMEPITLAAMAYVIGRVKEDVSIPYGVNCLWDPISSLDVAKATGGQFIREIISGVYASDFGIWNTNAGETARHRHRIGADHIKMLYNIVPEAAVYIAERDIAAIAKTTEFNCKPDAICVSGLTAGAETDTQVLTKVKNAVIKTPIFCNTGCNKDNIVRQLSASDGAVCATTFKVDGKFENPVDYNRVKEFMDVVKEFRKTL